MKTPASSAAKAEWRAWARTLDPVAPAITDAVNDHLRHALRDVDGPVLGYRALRDEVALALAVDAIASLDDDRRLTIGDLVVDEIAVVVVPARVFDRDGFRLGRGGGHYDRLLPRLRPEVPVIGVTCTDRIVERLPPEPHQRPMTHQAT
ncbi:MAG: hypothetical protein OSA99_08960, partial [Acidimicrobiales bacterium]|nr:hypothetical protein [Acidimicrobiales bacterium]